MKKIINMGIKGRIVLYFTAFILLMLVVIWVVQISLLGVFYRRTKLHELEEVSQTVSSYLGTGSLEDITYEMSTKYKICMIVFETSGDELGRQVVSVESTPMCLIHHLTPGALGEFYSKALASGGRFVERFTMGKGLVQDVPRGSAGDDGDGGEERRIGGDEVTMAVSVISASGRDGRSYAIFADTEFTQMHTAETLLNTQFLWLAGSIVLLTAFVAYIFAVNISGPLTNMNESAKKLAAGDYEPNFRVEGYRETRELAETLNFAASEISRSDRLQRELIANVSHDLRTPLTMISGYAEVMRDIPGENTPENVQVIIDESNHLSALVNDMLDLSKIEAGVKKPEKTEFSLTAAVSDVLERYSQLREHDGYSIEFEHGEDVSVCADRTMILQVLYNLVNNAINYCGADKKVIVTQSVAESESGESVRITVRDHGEGISPENIPLVWDRYYRVDKLHKRSSVGSGLGLSIVKKILQQHGALFGVESVPGEGSAFWFELPGVRGQADGAAPERPGEK